MQLCVDVSIVKDIYDIPRSVLNKKTGMAGTQNTSNMYQ